MENPSRSHLPYEITQCNLHPTLLNVPHLNPSHAKRYSTYLPRRDGKLSWHFLCPTGQNIHGGNKIVVPLSNSSTPADDSEPSAVRQ